ncbi:MAG: gfo/Idh/MocA family oxidoreductase, partial [Spirochaetota bacterium]
GAHAAFHTNCNAGIPERRIYILGSEGSLRSDLISGEIEVKRIGFNEKVMDESTGVKGGHGESDSVLTDHLVKMMVEQEEPLTSIDDGICSAVTCFGIDEALRTGTVVEMKSFWEKIDCV